MWDNGYIELGKGLQMIELSPEETKRVYNAVCDLEPTKIERERKCAMVYHVLEGKTYALVYDQSCDWFCDVAYEITGE